MKITRILVGIALPATALSGCATHPIPYDMTGERILSIVRNIRCEVYDVLRQRVIKVLRESKVPKSLALADRLAKGEFQLRNLDAEQMDVKSAIRIQRFAGSAIKMDFEFQITENNDNSVDGNFKVPFTKDSFSLGIKAGNKQTREGHRNFAINDNFNKLVDRVHCDRQFYQQPVPGYPITGNIGLAEVIGTFIDLAKEGENTIVVAKDGTYTSFDSKKPQATTLDTYSDTITFTTKVSGTITPTLTLAPVSNKFKLTSLSGIFGSDRTDIHKVLVTLILPKPEPKTTDLKIKLKDNVVLTITVPQKYGTRKVARRKPRRFADRPPRVRVRGKLRTSTKFRYKRPRGRIFFVPENIARDARRRALKESQRQQELDSNAIRRGE